MTEFGFLEDSAERALIEAQKVNFQFFSEASHLAIGLVTSWGSSNNHSSFFPISSRTGLALTLRGLLSNPAGQSLTLT